MVEWIYWLKGIIDSQNLRADRNRFSLVDAPKASYYNSCIC